MDSKKILLVEDDHTLGYVLQEYLSMNGYQVQWAQDGEAGLKLFQSKPFDLCLLDIMMPKKDGFDLARDIKQLQPDIPLLFLTAKSLKIDKLKGFQLGADDYVTKPVDEEELIARIQAILRRSNKDSSKQPSLIQLGKFQFDVSKRILQIDEQVFNLTEKEAELLKMLVHHKNNLLDRNQTLKNIWGDTDYFNRRSMDVHISHLRKILKADPQLKIVNVHNKGFILEDGA